jgi:hypothetical protein
MPSFEFDIGEQARVGARFVADVRDEIQRAFFSEKSFRKITQQQVAEKLGTSRAVINRQVMGLENMTLRRVAELLWAIGWRPNFQAEKIPAGENYFSMDVRKTQNEPTPVLRQKSDGIVGKPDPAMQRLWDELANKPTPVALAA